MSRQRLEDHRRLWAAKPVLAQVYGVWFEALLDAAGTAETILEVGAGPGFLSEYVRRTRPQIRWLASDLTEAPWNDVVADAHALPFGEAAMDALVGLDVIHHLSRPELFLLEASRVVRPGGRIALIEPWVTPLSYPVYRWFHQEGCDVDIKPWDPFPGEPAHKDAFLGNAAIPWKIVKAGNREGWNRFGFGSPSLTLFNGFAYLLSLGFRNASLLPRPLAQPFITFDRLTRPLASVVGMRALVVWQRLGRGLP